MERQYDWAGPWQLDRYDMTWWRPYYNYHFMTGEKTDIILSHRGPMVRRGPLRDVIHLDVPLAVLRSHPDTPNALPENHEGMWTSTNPAWPEQSIDAVMRKLGARASWEDTSSERVSKHMNLSQPWLMVLRLKIPRYLIQSRLFCQRFLSTQSLSSPVKKSLKVPVPSVIINTIHGV